MRESSLERFSSGWKRNYYGKGDVTVYRLERNTRVGPGQGSIFAASVKMLLYGDAFWPTYTEGDNTGLIATDSMKNFIQRESLEFRGGDLESYCRFLAEKILTDLSADRRDPGVGGRAPVLGSHAGWGELCAWWSGKVDCARGNAP